MSFTNQQIQPSWFELFVIATSSDLSGLHVADIASIRFGDYGSCPDSRLCTVYSNLAQFTVLFTLNEFLV
ncbi:unnamed protein product [Hymenolepis diminuta]|uniref:Uncharacterized protein n=1 Tax=Hymenolepis diminuta TaxID=6216 RepID=A0A0R3STB0_HYMDI|nr:unnamed protein product [Hymenolepis diminuta]